jgi:hypothetical protein
LQHLGGDFVKLLWGPDEVEMETGNGQRQRGVEIVSDFVAIGCQRDCLLGQSRRCHPILNGKPKSIPCHWERSREGRTEAKIREPSNARRTFSGGASRDCSQ